MNSYRANSDPAIDEKFNDRAKWDRQFAHEHCLDLQFWMPCETNPLIIAANCRWKEINRFLCDHSLNGSGDIFIHELNRKYIVVVSAAVTIGGQYLQLDFGVLFEVFSVQTERPFGGRVQRYRFQIYLRMFRVNRLGVVLPHNAQFVEQFVVHFVANVYRRFEVKAPGRFWSKFQDECAWLPSHYRAPNRVGGYSRFDAVRPTYRKWTVSCGEVADVYQNGFLARWIAILYNELIWHLWPYSSSERKRS